MMDRWRVISGSGGERMLSSPESLGRAFAEQCHYYLEDAMLARIWLALTLGKPILAEGEPGCGKTELARALSGVLATELIRVTFGEHIRPEDLFFRYEETLREAYLKAHPDQDLDKTLAVLRSERFMRPGALLRAIRAERRGVLALDEIDKARDGMADVLLEFLEEFTISDSLHGTFEPVTRPFVIITSNNTRPVPDQLRDRCAFVFFKYPAPEREAALLATKSGAPPRLAQQVAYLCRAFREIGFKSPPSIREGLDMMAACERLRIKEIDRDAIVLLMNLAVKRQDDWRRAEQQLEVLYGRIREMNRETEIVPAATGEGA